MNFGAVYLQIGLESEETFYRRLVVLSSLYTFYVHRFSTLVQLSKLIYR